jgi:hypothetical protein
MKNLYINNFGKFLIALTLIFLFFTNTDAIANETCKSPKSDGDFCQKKVQNLSSINNQLEKAFSSGSVINISQPPLVIVPKIEINVPYSVTSESKINQRPKTITQPKLKKNLDKNYFTKIIAALDTTGKKHLNQCISKLSDNMLKHHYNEFSSEINTLKSIALKDTIKSSKIGFLLSRRPSQKDCFKYLDFLLMIS